uniref:cyclin-dependent kinase n=1 Tax=Hucho hucho TaxID=62062 RepID=A0A4W5LCC5_9TELE
MEKYENLGMVGEGSYGMVMKCRHKENGRIVAVKKFLESEDDKTSTNQSIICSPLLQKLRHENLVNLLEVWKKRRRWYLVFEFVERISDRSSILMHTYTVHSESLLTP